MAPSPGPNSLFDLIVARQRDDQVASFAAGEMQVQSAIKLSITHTIGHEPSKLIAALSNAWPMALSNLKSLLENGRVALDAHP
jgi:hypothetical protein